MTEARVDIDKLVGVLKKLPSAIDVEMRKAFRQHGLNFRASMIKDRFGGFQSSAPRPEGGKMQNRTGTLRRSFGSEVVGGLGKGTPLTLAVFSSGVKYARIQEYGGEVRPKSSKYLTVPLPDAMTRSGVVRASARQLFQQYPDQMSVIRSPKSGQLFIVSDGKPGARNLIGKNAETQWLFVLKKSVELKPRLGFRDQWASPKMRQDRANLFNAAIDRAAAKAGGG